MEKTDIEHMEEQDGFCWVMEVVHGTDFHNRSLAGVAKTQKALDEMTAVIKERFPGCTVRHTHMLMNSLPTGWY